MGMNSIPPSLIAKTEITIPEDKKLTSVENKKVNSRTKCNFD